MPCRQRHKAGPARLGRRQADPALCRRLLCLHHTGSSTLHSCCRAADAARRLLNRLCHSSSRHWQAAPLLCRAPRCDSSEAEHRRRRGRVGRRDWGAVGALHAQALALRGGSSGSCGGGSSWRGRIQVGCSEVHCDTTTQSRSRSSSHWALSAHCCTSRYQMA